MWFDKSEIIEKIENGTIDFRSLMKEEENKKMPPLNPYCRKFSCHFDLLGEIEKMRQEVTKNIQTHKEARKAFV